MFGSEADSRFFTTNPMLQILSCECCSSNEEVGLVVLALLHFLVTHLLHFPQVRSLSLLLSDVRPSDRIYLTHGLPNPASLSSIFVQ